MIKKVFNILLAFTLLFSTTGITIFSHYCGGNLIEKSVYFKTEGCCKGPCNCCHTDIISVKVTDSFLKENSDFNFNDFVKKLLDINKIPMAYISGIYSDLLLKHSTNEVIIWLLHPLVSEVKASLICVFRI